MTVLPHSSLQPGLPFPSLEINVVGIEETQPLFDATSERAKLIVVFRGAFCPFCRKTIEKLKETLPLLQEAEIDLIAISADKQEVAEKHVQDNEITFPVGYNLGVQEMKQLGVYVSAPTNYIEQEQLFSEPAWFLVLSNGLIKFLDYSSVPFGGRPDVERVVQFYKWTLGNGSKVAWGAHAI
ncbi:hypothetical protein BCR33DRAFT_715929 [Rhizoclosmatium globosum]|uniref:Thioredoxin domain-containing protein n=1 Tax=Rhizoclosmatium globosum TaxID=329046 RepID=A0A1Y2CFU3_9FUNG|nr:hypothetical protein BCR33DRAFT_715929 [Rhizoclosmatium globosum]|eukprot:ORY45899.1 hypothetical protein BCR33DRAFT_715929 [Rhizoclosmatium globosum]